MNKYIFAVLLFAVPAAAAPQVAIVIDDFGLNYKKTPPDEEWMAQAGTMTFAVMPESPRTKKVCGAWCSPLRCKRYGIISTKPMNP